MFQMHPELTEEMSPASQAFLAGYICHLAADEVWITSVFRPNFDVSLKETRLTDNEVEANIWDRAMQLNMDRQTLPQLPSERHPRELLSCADKDGSMPFFY